MAETSEESICVRCKNSADDSLKLAYSSCKACYEQIAAKLLNFKKARKYLTPEIDRIEENLYLGNEDTALDKEILLDHGITHILAVGPFVQMPFEENFRYYNIPVNDSPHQDISCYFKPVFEFINQAKTTYIHCSAGISRSPTFAIAYIMIARKMTFDKAFNFVKERRSKIRPNDSFQRQLRQLEKQISDGMINLC